MQRSAEFDARLTLRLAPKHPCTETECISGSTAFCVDTVEGRTIELLALHLLTPLNSGGAAKWTNETNRLARAVSQGE